MCAVFGRVGAGTRFARRESMNEQRSVVLAAIDASSAANLVVAAAAKLAQPPAELHVVHVIELPDMHKLTAQLEAARELLERATAASPVVATLHVAVGAPAKEILQVAAHLHADLIVVGTRELNALDRLLLGSVAEKVARRAQCPVQVIRPANYENTEPEIEKPCPACIETQKRTNGAQLWCERHSKRHVHARLHYEFPESFALGSSLIRPE